MWSVELAGVLLSLGWVMSRLTQTEPRIDFKDVPATMLTRKPRQIPKRMFGMLLHVVAGQVPLSGFQVQYCGWRKSCTAFTT